MIHVDVPDSNVPFHGRVFTDVFRRKIYQNVENFTLQCYNNTPANYWSTWNTLLLSCMENKIDGTTIKYILATTMIIIQLYIIVLQRV